MSTYQQQVVSMAQRQHLAAVARFHWSLGQCLFPADYAAICAAVVKLHEPGFAVLMGSAPPGALSPVGSCRDCSASALVLQGFNSGALWCRVKRTSRAAHWNCDGWLPMALTVPLSSQGVEGLAGPGPYVTPGLCATGCTK